MVKLNKQQKKIAKEGYQIESRPSKYGNEYIILEKKVSKEGVVKFQPIWKKTGFWNIFNTEMETFNSIKEAKSFIENDVAKNHCYIEDI